ncbi:MAG: ribosome assembly cofactor RimP [Flavobacteriales bacterium]|jgi:ribosome maturation factor RimP|nr:ribosome assembly cofactor RimP [Crocinitomicaceae bacterium]NBX79823.1 ribosome assembly cofactor RimP [Flavobacteriales bacterium]
MINRKEIEGLVEERIQELNNGLYVVEMTISSSNVIRIELDKLQGGVTVTDCMSVSRNVEHNLDREKADFELHVSSAGLDKPLRHINQYVKNIGRELEVFRKDGTKVEGEIVKVSDDRIVLSSSEMQIVENKKKKERVEVINEILLADIKEAKIVISFK